MIRTKFFARTALGLALAVGIAGATASPVLAKDKDKPAEAPKANPSKAYVPVFVAAKNALDAAQKKPDVIAARQTAVAARDAWQAAKGSARAPAKAKFDAAVAALAPLLTAEKAAVDKSTASATNADDKYLAGQLTLAYGNLAVDLLSQRLGVQQQIDSGKVAAADKPKYLMVIGNISMELAEYAAARTAFQAASDAGASPGDALINLSDAYMKDNQAAAGLKVLQDAITKTGAAAPEGWMRFGVAAAYKAKLPNDATSFANQLVNLYPSTENWSLAIAVVRDLNSYQGYDQISLLRLMERTKSFSEERDYVDYIQALSKRGLPGEELKIIDQGLAAGKLKPSDEFVIDSRKEGQTRLASDKASLPAQEKSARAPTATAAAATSAGDTFLSYDQPAKAEEFYLIALGKPGVEASRVNLQLGIAQADQGKWADAQATLAKVTDSRAPIAQLWIAYAKAKAAGK